MLTLDGHAVYVLGAYGVAAIGLIGIAVASYRRWRAMERLVGTLERTADRPPRHGTAPDDDA